VAKENFIGIGDILVL